MYIEAEEKFLYKVGLLEDGAKDDVKGGEATRLCIEGGVVVLSGVFLGEGIPEAVELLQGHVENVLRRCLALCIGSKDILWLCTKSGKTLFMWPTLHMAW